MRPLPRLAALLGLLAVLMSPVRAGAQSILRDAETERFFRDISKDMVVAAGLDPKSVQIVLIGDPSINAFVTGGQNIFVHSGLLVAADNVGEVQGVIAHEIGHIAGGHNVRFNEGAGPATSISLLSLVGAAAAVALGAGEAGMALLGLGTSAAQGKFLAFTRDQESRADQAGARYLSAAGVSGKGSISFFQKLLGQEFRLAIPQTNEYARTHPLSGTRIANLENVYDKDPAWNRPADPALQARFLRIKGKLVGFVDSPTQVMRTYPESDMSDAAHYARAYALHRSAYPDQATAETDMLLKKTPNDPFVLELKGQILLESGKVQASLPVLREAVRYAPNEPLIQTLLGHALISTENPADFAEAEPLLRRAVAQDRENPFAWYQLGVIYDRKGDAPRAALAAAERYSLEDNAKGAAANARLALAGLPRGSPDWLRADDIALVADDALGKKKRR
ncbi:M48 family metalloprotease [Polymorphobacter fuscus]|uniref:M48 family metalloprotease n=1 Tax=Sandarakinorhabdus fusca TaxID=1439888 RepID=A0A7C9KYG9_9SPHN|nr:M48 family metalloprotease [Polymorphobacter fuscus]KAB7647662.1 M48 family metalloprotease [Polymorphobacter fuscus]MQT16948.1 M48 family metalloprotease [Polymorphobacter fuscus]NJC09062.1 putative Zn-dependent protease [Polymorphobacter fuscus]